MSDIRLYNTLSRSIEDFRPLSAGKVSMYQCGPTVYDAPHLGNYRTYIMDDLLRRMFEYNGYAVDQAMNITDVDDKTIRRSRQEGSPLSTLTRTYERQFFSELAELHVLMPHRVLRATEHVDSMIRLIQKLIDVDIAYAADDGVYMRIAAVPGYGQLARINVTNDPESSMARSRIANDEYDKGDPRDFALWKFRSPDDGEVFWKAAFGDGRPGWHIECSAMSMEALGPTLDIHTGGTDLIFPHHTNEIAQSEAATGKPFVRHWVHGGFMNVNGEKMAKSKSNFLKLADLAELGISPLGFRYWLLTAQYRSPVNFSADAALGAQNALIRLMSFVAECPEGGSSAPAYTARFREAINADLDTPKAVALAWELVKDPAIRDADKRATLIEFDRVFGLGLAEVPRTDAGTEEIPPDIQALRDAREEARMAKDWAKADALRHEIESRGYMLRDTPDGPLITPA